MDNAGANEMTTDNASRQNEITSRIAYLHACIADAEDAAEDSDAFEDEITRLVHERCQLMAATFEARA